MHIHFFNRHKRYIPIIIAGLGIFCVAKLEIVLILYAIYTSGFLLHAYLTHKHVISSNNVKLCVLTDEGKERDKQIKFIQNLLFSYLIEGPNISGSIHLLLIIQEILHMKENLLTNKKITVLLHHRSNLTAPLSANNPCWFIFINELLDIFIQDCPPETIIIYQLITPNKQKNLPFLQLIFTDDLPIPSCAFKKISKQDVERDACSQGRLKALIEKLGLFIHISFSMQEGNKLIIAIPLNATPSTDMHSNVVLFNR